MLKLEKLGYIRTYNLFEDKEKRYICFARPVKEDSRIKEVILINAIANNVSKLCYVNNHFEYKVQLAFMADEIKAINEYFEEVLNVTY